MTGSELVPPSKRTTYRPSDKGFVAEKFRNVKTNSIEITEDKLLIILMKHLGRVSSASDWVNPLSLVVTFLIVFITSSFNDALGISKEFWKALFVLATIASAVWLTVKLISAFANRGMRSVEFLIGQVKNTTENGSRAGSGK